MGITITCDTEISDLLNATKIQSDLEDGTKGVINALGNRISALSSQTSTLGEYTINSQHVLYDSATAAGDKLSAANQAIATTITNALNDCVNKEKEELTELKARVQEKLDEIQKSIDNLESQISNLKAKDPKTVGDYASLASYVAQKLLETAKQTKYNQKMEDIDTESAKVMKLSISVAVQKFAASAAASINNPDSIGTAVGGALGAAIGGLNSGVKGAVTGTALGGILGGAIGTSIKNWMDTNAKAAAVEADLTKDGTPTKDEKDSSQNNYNVAKLAAFLAAATAVPIFSASPVGAVAAAVAAASLLGGKSSENSSIEITAEPIPGANKEQGYPWSTDNYEKQQEEFQRDLNIARKRVLGEDGQDTEMGPGSIKDEDGDTGSGGGGNRDNEMVPGSIKDEDGDTGSGDGGNRDNEMVPGSINDEDGDTGSGGGGNRDNEMVPGSINDEDGNTGSGGGGEKTWLESLWDQFTGNNSNNNADDKGKTDSQTGSPTVNPNHIDDLLYRPEYGWWNQPDIGEV